MVNAMAKEFSIKSKDAKKRHVDHLNDEVLLLGQNHKLKQEINVRLCVYVLQWNSKLVL